MRSITNLIHWFSCLLICFVSVVNAAEPPYIIIEQPLSFGRLAVVQSNNVSSVSIDENGEMTTTKGIYIIELGHSAQFLMVNYVPYTRYEITTFISDTETTTGNINSNQFTLKTISTPLTVTTDSTGSASFSVGGVLETSGDISKIYYDAVYQARFIISVNH